MCVGVQKVCLSDTKTDLDRAGQTARQGGLKVRVVPGSYQSTKQTFSQCEGDKWMSPEKVVEPDNSISPLL